MASSYYRNALGAILVYDITKADTFSSVNQWLLELRKYLNDKVIVCLIGNKKDLVE